MKEKQDYVKPPKKSSSGQKMAEFGEGLKRNYDHLKPGYWKRKLPHLLIVFPVTLLFFISFGAILGVILTLVACYLYPFSLYWYKQSFLYIFLSNLYFFGSIWSIILKTILVIIGGMVLAGILAPITGYLTLRKCRRENLVIGEEKDFV